jgi:hypothetical protein
MWARNTEANKSSLWERAFSNDRQERWANHRIKDMREKSKITHHTMRRIYHHLPAQKGNIIKEQVHFTD